MARSQSTCDSRSSSRTVGALRLGWRRRCPPNRQYSCGLWGERLKNPSCGPSIRASLGCNGSGCHRGANVHCGRYPLTQASPQEIYARCRICQRGDGDQTSVWKPHERSTFCVRFVIAPLAGRPARRSLVPQQLFAALRRRGRMPDAFLLGLAGPPGGVLRGGEGALDRIPMLGLCARFLNHD